MLQLGPEVFDLLNAKQWVGNQQPVEYGEGGLSAQEIQLIEMKLGFPLPEDFSYLLQHFRDPGGVLFPWADFDKKKYDDSIVWVRTGIEFSVQASGLWLARWGEKPDALPEALRIVREDFETWPKLLPICGHRFLAAEPCRSDNPVFSIMQTDIIYYGANLAHYLLNEFVDAREDGYAKHVQEPAIKHIDIWSDFVDRTPGFIAQWKPPQIDTTAIRDKARKLVGETPQRKCIKLVVKQDGTFALNGVAMSGLTALGDILQRLSQRTAPPDLQLLEEMSSKGSDALRQCQILVGKFGYRPVIYMAMDGGIVRAVHGSFWRKE